MAQIQNIFDALPIEIKRHSLRTALYARALAEGYIALYANPTDLEKNLLFEAIYDGGMYHDIGKVMYSANLLFSKELPTEAESKTMQMHPQRTVEILLSDKTFLAKNKMYQEIVIDSCLGHHEHYDGSGYPKGLSIDEISISAQIIALCDRLDTLCAGRTYQEPLTFEEAYQFLLKENFVTFSPRIICAMMQSKKELREICLGQKKYRRAVVAPAKSEDKA